MSDALLSTIRALTRGAEGARISSTGDAENGRSGEARLQFRDYLPDAETARELDSASSAPVSRMTGSAADLAALNGRMSNGLPARFGQDGAATASLDAEPEAWSFVAPSVALASPVSRMNPTASYKIYARASESVSETAPVSVFPEDREADKRR
ncbi:MAG: hypothetical protein H7834_01505 [Magnetococcus sp. YQC-9]